MGSILNFVFLFNDENYPSWCFKGPLTDSIQNKYNHTFGIKFDNTLNNIIVLETHEHFKGTYQNLETEIYGTTLLDILKNNDVKIMFGSIADPPDWRETVKLKSIIDDAGLTDKVYYIESSINNKNKKNTFCYHFFLEEPTLIKKKSGEFNFFKRKNDLGYKSEDIQEIELDKYRENKFLSFNRTVDKTHRWSLFHTYLTNDFSDSSFSFLNFSRPFLNQIDAYLSSPQLKLEEYTSKLPIELDTKNINENTNLTRFRTNNTFKKHLFLNSCINIVTETTFEQNELFISEKIIKPIIGYQPFIVIGPYQYLKELKNLGFKSFSNFWDESYDEIINPKERYFAIEKIILELNNKTIDEINEIYQKTKNICIYNRKVFDNYEEDSLTNIIKQIENEK